VFLSLVVCGCTSPAPTIGGPAPTITGIVTAGPTCPVEASPEPSACTPRPVSGAVVIASEPNGTEVSRATTDTRGAYLLGIPTAGTVIVSALPVAGLAQPPAPVTVDVAPNGQSLVNLEYDTGIR
jgi:hypothetical protein